MSRLHKGLAALRCDSCGSTQPLEWTAEAGVCRCGRRVPIVDGIVRYTPQQTLAAIPEVDARDRQAAGYLAHSKFPTQLARFDRFLERPHTVNGPVYELGCGPGPFTSKLTERGYDVVAVDFSVRSLEINRASLSTQGADRAAFVHADVNALRMAPESTDLLLMCDFLQHLGNQPVRDAFLQKAFSWLRPGGRFYLTFFNLNVKNRAKKDVRGSFGAIPYERLRYKEVIGAFPSDIVVESAAPMNIFTSAAADRAATLLPGAALFARMMSISGAKR